MMIQNEDGLELSYCEFKPSHNSSMALYQRSKNLRLNQTIKLQMKKMGINDKIVSFNWEGSYGTFFVLEDCSQVMVARNANCLIIPSNPLALDDDFTMTVLSMIVWKKHLLNLSKKLTIAADKPKRPIAEVYPHTCFTLAKDKKRRLSFFFLKYLLHLYYIILIYYKYLFFFTCFLYITLKITSIHKSKDPNS